MSDEPDKIVLDFLRAQFDRVHESIAKLDLKVSELSQLMTTLYIDVLDLSANEQSHYDAIIRRINDIG